MVDLPKDQPTISPDGAWGKTAPLEMLLRSLRETTPDIRVAAISEFPDYAADSEGGIWSIKQHGSWRKLSVSRDKYGYCCVNVRQNKRSRTQFVHTLVLTAFVGPRPAGMEGSHFPDPDKTNNRIANLQWETPRDNQFRKRRHLSSGAGPLNGKAKVGVREVLMIRERVSRFENCGTIAKELGISPGEVSRIAMRRKWASVPEVSVAQWDSIATLLQETHAHLAELEEAWMRGVIREGDHLGGTRSNRNTRIRAAIEKIAKSG